MSCVDTEGPIPEEAESMLQMMETSGRIWVYTVKGRDGGNSMGKEDKG